MSTGCHPGHQKKVANLFLIGEQGDHITGNADGCAHHPAPSGFMLFATFSSYFFPQGQQPVRINALIGQMLDKTLL